ncbi:MAG: c-type cytochrome [Pseudomonadota bacterium]|nr:c-type cytochrome [Pseudomonadota bacterium]
MKKTTIALCIFLTSHSIAYAEKGSLIVGTGLTGDIEAGKEKTTTYNCIACHGADGKGLAPNWPNLAGQHGSYIIQQLKAFQSGSRSDPSMSPMAMPLKDKEQDMADIAAYYASLSPHVSSVNEAEVVAPGQKLYRGGQKDKALPACTACHGPKGHGNPAAQYPLVSGQQIDYTAKQLNDYKSGTRGGAGGSAAIMSDIAVKMSDKEIKAVAEYMAVLY